MRATSRRPMVPHSLLKAADCGPKVGRGQQPRPQRTGPALPDVRQRSQGNPHLIRHMLQLPANFGRGHVPAVGLRQDGCPHCVGRGPQGVGTHVADPYRLTGGPGSRHRRGINEFTGGHSAVEAAADLIGHRKLAPGKRTGSGYGGARAVIAGNLSFKYGQNSLRAIRGPACHKPSLRLTQSLRRIGHGKSCTPTTTVRRSQICFAHPCPTWKRAHQGHSPAREDSDALPSSDECDVVGAGVAPGSASSQERPDRF